MGAYSLLIPMPRPAPGQGGGVVREDPPHLPPPFPVTAHPNGGLHVQRGQQPAPPGGVPGSRSIVLTQQHLSRITSLKVGGLNGLHAIIGTQLNILKIETVHLDVTIEAQGHSITKVFFFPVFGEQRQAPVSVPGTQGIVVAKLIKETDASFHIQQAFSPGPPQAHPPAGPPLRDPQP